MTSIILEQKTKRLYKNQVRLDVSKVKRTSIPEIVMAANKEPRMIVETLVHLTEINGRSLAYKCSASIIKKIKSLLSNKYTVTVHSIAHIVIVAKRGIKPQQTGGRIGIISAGSSDIPIAEEAAIIATEMGSDVTKIWDVGVAGLHRLIKPLEDLTQKGTDAIIVVAGMDGALAPVVAGLVNVPVIGLPTSIGHGFGGQGIGALTTMLQSRSLGITVVNIDNGIAAGIAAALIANQTANARKRK